MTCNDSLLLEKMTVSAFITKSVWSEMGVDFKGRLVTQIGVWLATQIGRMLATYISG